MKVGEKGEQFFIAAFVDDKGASILANRIREQFGRLSRLTQAGVTLSVSFRMLPSFSEDVSASTDTLLASMAIRLEESVKSNIISEAINHE